MAVSGGGSGLPTPTPPVVTDQPGKRLFPSGVNVGLVGSWVWTGGAANYTNLGSIDDNTTYLAKTSTGSLDGIRFPVSDWTIPSNMTVIALRAACSWYSSNPNSAVQVSLGDAILTDRPFKTDAGPSYQYTDMFGATTYYYAQFDTGWYYTAVDGSAWSSARIAQALVILADKATTTARIARFTAAWVDVWAVSNPYPASVLAPSGTINDTLTPTVQWAHNDAIVLANVTNKVIAANVATITFGSAHGLQVGNTIDVSIGDGNYDGSRVITAVTSTTLSYAVTTTTSASAGATGTVAFGDGAAQAQYEVKVFTEAQAVAGGFSPDTTTPVWSTSGSGATAAAVLGVVLANATQYRAYVRTAKTTATTTIWSAWAFSSFTTAVTPPAAPGLTVTLDNAAQRVQLALTTRINILSAQDSGLETAGSAGSWIPGVNCSVTQSTTVADTGQGALRLSSTAAGVMSASTGPGGTAGYPVAPSTAYAATARVRAGGTGRTCTLGIAYYTAAGAFISTTTGSGVADSSGAWTTITVTGTSPATAAYAALIVTVSTPSAASELHYVDSVALHPGTVAAYMPGGASSEVTVTRTSGGVTQVLRGPFTLSLAQAGTFYDYEAPRGVAATYAAYVTATLESGAASPSATTTAAPVTPSNDGTHWLKAPLNPAINLGGSVASVLIKKGSVSFTREEDQGVMRPLGRSKAVVVAGDLEGEDGSFVLHALGSAAWAAVEQLILHQASLLWQEPDGTQKYIRLTSPRSFMRQGNVLSNPRYEATFQYVETDAP